MRWSRGCAVWVVVGIVAVVAGSVSGGARADTAWYDTSYDRRGATEVAANVFVGQVIGEKLVCSEASGPDHIWVEDHFDVKVERNVKGRVEGTVVVRQTTDDTGQFGRDGRLVVGRTYLFITRSSASEGMYPLIDDNLGYVQIDSPEERAELLAEIEGYLAEPTPARTPRPTIDPEVAAIQEAEVATLLAVEPTSVPCAPWVIATATASAAELGRDNRALGPIFSPDFELVTATPTS